ncbi:methyltransferase type 12 [Comamonas serinivorans]|uniref:Methyltransferase type 12 n=1 Tax=Comamonas serinivorans TaxID=1082851 RepID=A0A1Y0EU68_9BURK|nr:methyltransferase type 12 [Comamonas serinivorans]
MPDEAARTALARGQALLAAGDADGAATALRQAALSPATQLAAYNLIETHGLLGAFAPWMGLDAHIDPQDDVFGFFNGHGTWSSPMRDYLADGWRTLSELLLLLERSGRPLTGLAQVLEFASGHGRFTRHLVKALGAERITVSDVVPGAVAFATQQFGVQGLMSTADPAQLQWPRRYDLVFVLSLFSHLPRATWQPWLAKIWDAVAPGGVLVVTTHGEFAAARAGVQTDAEGFHFHAESESHAIDAQEYGTTYTTREFVLARVAELSPQPLRVDLEPAWFWSHQDALVLHRP